MCKIVYLTVKRFDKQSKEFRCSLANELRRKGVEVVEAYNQDIFNRFRKHKTYGVALAFEFYKDGGSGRGLTLRKDSSYINREFAYNLSNNLDFIQPNIRWRELTFLESNDKPWYNAFNKVSSETKAIFNLCTSNNPTDLEKYFVSFNETIRKFSDEIIRCLRSEYDVENYRKRVKVAKRKQIKIKR